MRATSIYLAVVMVSTALSAQVKLGDSPTGKTASTSKLPAQVGLGSSPTVLRASPTDNGCPVGVVARRRSVGVVSTVQATSTMPPNQGVELSFIWFSGPGIDRITVDVHGLSAKGRMIPLATDPTSDVEETFELTRDAKATSLTNSYLQPKRARITEWIEVTSVKYTDGSTWHSSAGAQCTVTPSNFLLIAGR